MMWFDRGRAWKQALLAVGVLACLSQGCSQESPAPSSGSSSQSGSQSGSPSPSPAAGADGNRPPIVTSAKLTANSLTRRDNVSVDVNVDDPDGDRVTVRYQWLADDSPIEGQTGASLALSALRRGDRVSVDVIPVDMRGLAGPVYHTGTIEIGNTPPGVTRIVLEPAVARAGDPLHVMVEGSDPDGDPVKYVFQWWRNGDLVAATTKDDDRRTLATEGFTRGDSIVAGVTPYDAAGPGKVAYSEPVVLANRPPVITSSPTAPTGQGAFEYTVTATDPDNDPLTYKLGTAPAGMTIDAATGKIAWQVPAGFTSPQQVRVSVDDGNQGQAFQEFTLAPPPAR